jgi:integrase
MLFDQNGNRKYLVSEERRAFIEAARRAPPEVETFCLTLAFTGARISEVLALSPDRIDRSSQAIVFETLKRRRRGVYRAVPVPIELIVRMEEVHNLRHSDPRERLWSWGRTTAWQRVKRVMRTARVAEGLAMPKALRHAFGVHGIAESEIPLNMVRKWLGHARIETTAIYANAVGREERTIAARMWE